MNPLWIETLRPRLAHRSGRADRFRRAPDCRMVDIPDGSARVCDSRGSGPTLVWIPDPPVVIEHYRELREQLASEYRVVIVELPGIGFGLPRASFGFSVSGMGAALVDVLETLGLRDVTLVGTCLGGYAVQHAAQLAPNLVSRVVLLQTPSWADGQAWVARRDPRGWLRIPWLGQVLFQQLAAPRVGQWFDYALADSSRRGSLERPASTALKHGGCFCLASLFQQYLDPRQTLPRRIAQPTLILAGLADRSHASTNWEAAQELSTDVRLVAMHSAGHFPDLEAPAELAQELRGFL